MVFEKNCIENKIGLNYYENVFFFFGDISKSHPGVITFSYPEKNHTSSKSYFHTFFEITHNQVNNVTDNHPHNYTF